MKFCPNCQTELPDAARFCFHCGRPWEEAPSPPPEQTAWLDNPIQYFIDFFMHILRERVEEEHPFEFHQIYTERLYQSGFRDTLQRRAEQFEGKAKEVRSAKKIQRQVAELVDYFVTQHCKDLNLIPWPEAILKYQGLTWDKIDLFQMALDYLDFAHESEPVYTDFLQMPIEKLRNAGKKFLFPEKQERILLICDQSIMGSVREGFALTEKGLYWKAHLTRAARVYFDELAEIKREKQWININGQFFNVNLSINIKMMRLLKTIKRLQ